MDPEIKQLQEEIKRVGAVSADTNRLVHSMRRSQRWKSLLSIMWWLVILGFAGASYFYIQPYIKQATDAYGSAKDFQVQIQDFFAQFGRSGSQ